MTQEGKSSDDANGGVRVPPWIANPYQLVSWWEMQKFVADKFYAIGYVMAQAKASIEHPKRAPEPTAPVRDLFRRTLLILDTHCSEIGLKQTVKAVKRYLRQVDSSPPPYDEMAKMIVTLDDRISDEMEDNLFMFIPPNRAEYYGKPEAFGPEVNIAFPSAVFDIAESGNSFASARFTACVFHLMRVLEISLVAFAQVFPAVPTNKENWQQIIEKIESEIRAMPKAATKAPDWKEKMEQYAQIANSFMFFKDAWRNYTAHARGKYTEDEADSIYRDVRSFMRGLAKAGLHE